MAHLVWLQLDLFSYRPTAVKENSTGPRLCGLTDAQRDRRTGPQWLKSVNAYLEFCAGHSWRRLSDPAHRNDAHRLVYLDAQRIVTTALFAPEPLAEPLPAQDTPHVRAVNTRAAQLASKPRAALVSELLSRNPSLTDRRILEHLPRPKLARMVIDAREQNRAALMVTA